MENWLPPAAIITVIIAFNTIMIVMFNKRFDDLRSQMAREHDALAKKVDFLTDTIMKHITDHSIHNIK